MKLLLILCIVGAVYVAAMCLMRWLQDPFDIEDQL